MNDRLDAITKSMSMPKSTKVVMTLYGVSVIDIAVLFVGFMVGKWLSQLFVMGIVFQFIFYGLGFGTALFLIIRVQPKRPAWKQLLFMAIQDRGRHYPIQLEESKKEKEDIDE